MKDASTDAEETRADLLIGTSRRLSAYYLGQVGIKLLYLAGLVVATRAVGPSDWGLLSALLSIGFILITGVDLGLNPYATREVAAGRLPRRALFTAGARYRTLSSLVFLAGLPIIVASTISGIRVGPLVLILIYLLTDSWAKYIFALQRGAEVTRYEIIGGNVEKAIFAVWAIVALLGTVPAPSLLLVSMGFAMGAAVKLLVAIRGAQVSLDTSIFPGRYLVASASRLGVWLRESRALKGSADFLFMALFATIYFRIDVYMLAALSTNEQAGFYGAAYRLIEGFMFAPEGVLVVFSPLLVKAMDPYLRGGGSHISEQTVGSVTALQIAIGAPIVLGLVAEHRWIIDTVYGTDFIAAGPILFWLAPAFGFMTLNFLLGGLLTAAYLQRSLLLISVFAAGANVLANMVLIPRYGVIGAAAATVMTEAVVATAMAVRITSVLPARILLLPSLRVLGYFALTVLPATLLAVAYLQPIFRIGVEIAAAILFYLVLLRRNEIPNPFSDGRRMTSMSVSI